MLWDSDDDDVGEGGYGDGGGGENGDGGGGDDGGGYGDGGDGEDDVRPIPTISTLSQVAITICPAVVRLPSFEIWVVL